MSETPRSTTPDDPAGTTDSGRAGQAANLFDLRRIIGGLFLVYGAILTVVGLVSTSDADIQKSAGVHVNLLAGIGMLVMGVLFIAWALWRPLADQLED